MAEYAHLSVPNPEIAETLKVMAQQPPPKGIFALRDSLKTAMLPILQKEFGPLLPAESEYEVHDHMLDTGDGAKVLARSIVPRKTTPDETFPLLFWIHGGAWILGNVDMDDYQLRMTSVKLRVSVVNCEYRLAPENPFPTGLNDAYAGLKYVASHPDVFSASLSKGFIIAGGSAGANLSAVLAHRARNDPFFKDRRLTGQSLLVPCVIHPDAYPEKYKSQLLSMEQNADAPSLSRKALCEGLANYKAPPEDPEMSPLLFPSHQGLPPAHIQVCGLDPLRDEAFLYEKVLKENDVKTKLNVYPGAPHGVDYWLPNTEVGKRYREDFWDGLRWLLDIGSSKD